MIVAIVLNEMGAYIETKGTVDIADMFKLARLSVSVHVDVSLFAEP